MEEVWKDVVGYEGRYIVSNFGRIRSLYREFVNKRGRIMHITDRVMKTHLDECGYERVKLSGESGAKMTFVHRIVAESFIPNPNNHPMINHIDECKTNNRVDNLEWCDAKYNNVYGNRLELVSKILMCRSDLSKPVLMCDLSGNVLAEFGSIRDAARRVGGNQSFIGKACKGIYKTAYGHIWRYKNE